MHTPSLQIIPQRHTLDCAVACLAMVCGISYEETLQAFRHNVCIQGATIRQIQAAAKRLKRVLLWSRKVQDLTDETGILCVDSPRWMHSHLVVLKEGQIVDTDATLWDLDVFLAAYDSTPVSLMTLKEETRA